MKMSQDDIVMLSDEELKKAIAERKGTKHIIREMELQDLEEELYWREEVKPNLKENKA